MHSPSKFQSFRLLKLREKWLFPGNTLVITLFCKGRHKVLSDIEINWEATSQQDLQQLGASFVASKTWRLERGAVILILFLHLTGAAGDKRICQTVQIGTFVASAI
jgi:hypothetical protein